MTSSRPAVHELKQAMRMARGRRWARRGTGWTCPSLRSEGRHGHGGDADALAASHTIAMNWVRAYRNQSQPDDQWPRR
jgi:hypothetical protein